ncbi:MAG TPA: FAD-binding oxidoreductase [Micromonosporaceae bacterium]|nr:FAD-binding oxidoreductase [Micromonosporaceae bacterium]
MAVDGVLDALAAQCGEGFARTAGAADRVGERQGRWVAAPADARGVAGVLEVADRHDLAVVACGAGTKLDWGTPPLRVDVLLDTGRLAGVAVAADGATVTVGAGTPLRAVHAAATRAGRRLPLDVGSAGATVGGVLAVNEAGPLRFSAGAPRDLVTSVRYVRADGVVASAGGADTAGAVDTEEASDTARLLCGSFGTLAVITAATLRLQPVPAARAWVTRSVRTPLEMHQLTSLLLAAPVPPTAVEINLPRGELTVLVEGLVDDVTRRTRAAHRLLGGDASAAHRPPAWWGRYPFGADDIALRLAVPFTDLHAAIYALRDAAGMSVPVRGTAGSGVVYAALGAGTPPARVRTVVDAVRTTLLARGGSCVLLRAPDRVRAEVERGHSGAVLPLVRRVKERFDPRGRLAPGRLAGGR